LHSFPTRRSSDLTDRSAPVLRLGTLASRLSPLELLPCHRSDWFPQFRAKKSLRWCHAPYTPVAACPVIRLPASSSQEIETLLVLTTVLWITTRLRRVPS